MKPCCAKPENLAVKQERPDVVVRTCKLCGARHTEFTVDAGKFSTKLTA